MTAPQRLRLSRAKGFRLAPNAVVVARPSKWGNPFVTGTHGTRLQCAAMFCLLARGFIAFSHPDIEPAAQFALWKRIRGARKTIAGRDLACWCPLDGPCHADVLLCFANPGHPAPLWFGGGIELPRIRLGMLAPDYDRSRRKAPLFPKPAEEETHA